jgi:hypothetical protein
MAYPFIENILRSIFSVDVGLEEGDAQAALRRVLGDPEQKLIIEQELLSLYRDDSVSWVRLLDNDDYVVYPADSEEDAKQYVTSIIWNKVFS